MYVLEQSMYDTEAMLTVYEQTSKVAAFRPNFVMDQARQVVAIGDKAVYVLDQNGNRLLTFSPQNGQLQTIMQLPQNHQCFCRAS